DLTGLGMVHARLGQSRESAQAFRKVIALQPASPEAHLNLGIALADSFDLNGALAEFSEAARLAPNSASARYNKGRALFDLHRYDEARSELETACKLATKLGPALYLLALVQRQPDRAARAAALLKQLVALE